MALRPRPTTTPVGRSMELGLEVALAVVLALALGYYADRWLGTTPVFLFIFLILGFATAILIVYRFAKPADRRRESGPASGEGDE